MSVQHLMSAYTDTVDPNTLDQPANLREAIAERLSGPGARHC